MCQIDLLVAMTVKSPNFSASLAKLTLLVLTLVRIFLISWSSKSPELWEIDEEEESVWLKLRNHSFCYWRIDEDEEEREEEVHCRAVPFHSCFVWVEERVRKRKVFSSAFLKVNIILIFYFNNSPKISFIFFCFPLRGSKHKKKIK